MKKFIIKEKYFRKIIRGILLEVGGEVNTDYEESDKYIYQRGIPEKEFLTKEENEYIQNTKKSQKIDEVKYGEDNIEFIGKFEYKPGITIDKVILDDNSIMTGEKKKILDNFENIKEEKELLTGIAFISNIITKLENEKKEKKDPNDIKKIDECFKMLEDKKAKIFKNLDSIKVRNNKYIFKIPEGKNTIRWLKNEKKYALKAYFKSNPKKYKFWYLSEEDFSNFPDNESLYPDDIKSDKDILNLVINNKKTIKGDIEKAKKEKSGEK